VSIRVTKDDAIISECERYRYALMRLPRWTVRELQPAIFCMLNPSKADALINDATVIRGLGFARRWGSDGLVFVNQNAWRATDPRELPRTADPVGPENDSWLRQVASEDWSGPVRIICAWGKNATRERTNEVLRIFRSEKAELYCLSTCNDGTPKHPLYLRRDLQPIPFQQSH
jgi:hypothetical protein